MKAKYLFCFLLSFSLLGYGQTSIKNNYDIKKNRLLIKATAMYIHSVNQGFIDMDSAVVLACTANKFPVSMSFDEGYNDGSYLPGGKMVDENNIDTAKDILKQLKKTDKIRLLLHLGSHYLFKTGEKKEDLQQSLFFIQQAIELSNAMGIPKWKQQSNILLGKYYVQANNPVESKKIFAKVVIESRNFNDRKSLAEALSNQGTYLSLDDPDKEKALSESMILYRSVGEKELEIELLMKLLTVHFWKGNIDLAEKELLQASALQKKIGFKHLHYTSAPLAFIYSVKYNLNKSLFYSINSIETMEATNDMICADNFYLRLGNIYEKMEHTKEALELYKKSFDVGTKNINSGSWYKSFPLTIQLFIKDKRYKEALDYLKKADTYPPNTAIDIFYLSQTRASLYEKIGNNVLAEKYYLEMARNAENMMSTRTSRNVAIGYSQVSLFYAKTGKPDQAKFYADKALDVSKKTNQNFTIQELDLSLFKIDSLKGNYLSAIGHYQDYNKVNDSLYNVSKNREIEELKIQYETLKKEDNIKTLEMQSKLQQSKLHRSRLLINLSIGSILLLVVIIGLLYNSYKVKQKNNKELMIKENEISQQNIKLQHLLEDKEWLIKEIHHRVKNNLQTVISLLNSQSAYIDDDLALSTIKNSQHRIHAMSLIHQKLYMSENISTINMPIYINELVEYLKDSFNLKQNIRFKINIDEIELDVSQAIPLGLIINEAVTNSIKYAFPDNSQGIISISLITKDTDHYLLTIADNGTGIILDPDKKTKNSFGMSLIRGLSDDLDGKFSIENSNGTLLQLSFEKNEQTRKHTI
ncbi:Two-component sensor histidine kinase, contains HisKA and HATPase domains [Chryseobacterium wanjuense]|uniref:histidine kinase n=1 Tax=Chryseobacterium wanjuense TaxID=356305 RepID=A0A1I0NNJ5_9FLAO|nr:histidine kinase dimerization/phosphoacceptor domain -containing protein [Chryseobacterium wanjuense]SEW02440.1 Two-component sensor histidine kinase, contains HisKA and HATPase domains [Chryseobacterium wanjuense]